MIPEFGQRFNVWEMDGEKSGNNHGHPAVFPKRLAYDHIVSWSNPGDLVLDPFSGSGTTCAAAKMAGRDYLGIEVNPDYNERAARRIAQQVVALGPVHKWAQEEMAL